MFSIDMYPVFITSFGHDTHFVTDSCLPSMTVLFQALKIYFAIFSTYFDVIAMHEWI